MKFLGHYSSGILSLTIVTWIAIFIAKVGPSALFYLFAATSLSLVLLCAKAVRRHLCERCSSSVILNPEAEAQKYARSLKLAHASMVMKSSYIGALLFVSAVVIMYPDNYFVRGFWAATLLTVLIPLRAHVLHQKLTLWCPSCRQGGEEVGTSNPIPTMVG